GADRLDAGARLGTARRGQGGGRRQGDGRPGGEAREESCQGGEEAGQEGREGREEGGQDGFQAEAEGPGEEARPERERRGEALGGRRIAGGYTAAVSRYYYAGGEKVSIEADETQVAVDLRQVESASLRSTLEDGDGTRLPGGVVLAPRKALDE